ncbi:putative oligopeptide transporter, OPT family [Chitinophaga terrae (ex Kim and Jung 2007)]|uniref:Putative oligopeptide transporter, OPT family n=1 Tax=Chitinophaga terrae (ex Kim and Jung 2007) TaxID=408074 RepID=A0A1H4CT73_9BACT|nr:OPT/YSL family transporter [Chitinophaga terrae (ex Kim and Jung 2007)]GEP90444.1 oligopeptide transporter, OPT family [Chitinophaga terrae (ex Kim and Jung 2007)]SEA63518.1 putative oligopeptide transporter, OPT family [Chitinophaga terrae (ex Kim and Jung 2007)]
MADNNFKPFVAPEVRMKEFTLKSILLGCIFGIIFGAATTYLALKAGLTVSASIPIAVIAITLGRKFFKTTILENNIIQTTGSAGESIAAGVVFTLPGFLFLSDGIGKEYFNYLTILTLAIFGGILGTLMMIPLRKSLIVKEHGVLPYPEGTACGDVLIAGEKGGDFAKTAFYGLGFAFAYAILQKVLRIIAETPEYMTRQANKFFPSAKFSADITPEYMGVGYIIGPRIAGVLVAGGVLSWLALIPLLSSLIPAETIATQLVKLGYLADLNTAGGQGNWNPSLRTFDDFSAAIYYAYVRQIGAGAVAAGGFITLLKTIPTIIASFKGSLSSIKTAGEQSGSNAGVPRTERDLSLKVVALGSLALILLMAFLPQLPGESVMQKLLVGLLVVIFGAFFVTVSSRIVGLIGSSNNPISGMTIATLMGTCLVFIAVGWTGRVYEPMALVVGGMICIAAANAGGTSQDLKSGYIVGATPRYQQIALFIGAIVSSVVIGLTVKFLDNPTAEMVAHGVKDHAIGSIYFPAPQGTLMATLDIGILSGKLDWQFVIAGAFLAITMELCGINSLSFAVGAYLPLSTTLPIFVGGAIRGLVDYKQKKTNKQLKPEEEELGKGNLFATGLVAGGAVAGVVIAVLAGFDSTATVLNKLHMEDGLITFLGTGGYYIIGCAFFAFMGWCLYRIARKA